MPRRAGANIRRLAATEAEGRKPRHLGLIAAATLAGASNPVAIKAALGLGFPPFLLGFARTACVGLVFWAWCAREGATILGAPGAQRLSVLLASGFKAASVGSSFGALALLPASRVAILSAFSPIASLLLVRVLLKDERIGAMRLGGTILGLAGMLALMALQEGSGPQASAAPAGRVLAGDLITIFGILCAQAMIVFEKRALAEGVSPQALAGASSAAGVLMLAAVAAALGERLAAVPLTPAAALVFAYLVAVPGVFLFYARRWLTSALDVSYLAAFQTPERALAIALSMVVLGESVSLASLACFVVILAGTALATRDAARMASPSEVSE